MPFSLDIDMISTNVAVYKKVNNDFIFIAFNKMAQKTEKIPSNELIGKKLTEIFPGVKEFGLFDVLLRVYKTCTDEVFETSFYKDSRISGWRRNEIKKLENDNIIVFYSDKTIEVQTQKRLYDSKILVERQKETFQHIMENSEYISVQGYDESHKVVYWNKASEALYGYSSDEAMGKRLEELIIPASMVDSVHQGIEDWIHRSIEIASGELTLKDKNDNDVNVFTHHVMVKINDDHQEMYCIDINLKEIKLLQKELSMQKRLLETIFDVIPDHIWLKAKDGTYLYCNSRFEQYVGATNSEIMGKTDYDFVDADLANFFRKNDLKALELDAPRRNEEYLDFADGSYKGMFETTKIPMYDDENKLIGVLGISHDINERKKYEKKLEKSAHHDELTGLANRALFMERLSQLLRQRKTDTNIHAILFIDLDHFKDINDEKGHATGDKVLIEVAHRLKSIIRKGDTLARFGGDEFTILLENIHSNGEASKVAQKILDKLREKIIIDKSKYHVTSSIGISLSPANSTDSEVLIHYADIAMYRAKSSGKDAYSFFKRD